MEESSMSDFSIKVEVEDDIPEDIQIDPSVVGVLQHTVSKSASATQATAPTFSSPTRLTYLDKSKRPASRETHRLPEKVMRREAESDFDGESLAEIRQRMKLLEKEHTIKIQYLQVEGDLRLQHLQLQKEILELKRDILTINSTKR